MATTNQEFVAAFNRGGGAGLVALDISTNGDSASQQGPSPCL